MTIFLHVAIGTAVCPGAHNSADWTKLYEKCEECLHLISVFLWHLKSLNFIIPPTEKAVGGYGNGLRLYRA